MQNRTNRSSTSNALAWIACGLISAAGMIGCTNYGGSVPIDDDAGLQKRPPGSVDASVPIDDDAGLQKAPNAPKP
jgi:hypothetical protein